QLAVSEVEDEIRQAERDFEDATRSEDEWTASEALQRYATAKHRHDVLSGATERRQQAGQWTVAKQNYLSRRRASGDDVDVPQRRQEFMHAHNQLIAAGVEEDTPQYFRAMDSIVDAGNGRQPPLTEAEAARISGIDEATYARNAAHLRALKRSGR